MLRTGSFFIFLGIVAAAMVFTLKSQPEFGSPVRYGETALVHFRYDRDTSCSVYIVWKDPGATALPPAILDRLVSAPIALEIVRSGRAIDRFTIIPSLGEQSPNHLVIQSNEHDFTAQSRADYTLVIAAPAAAMVFNRYEPRIIIAPDYTETLKQGWLGLAYMMTCVVCLLIGSALLFIKVAYRFVDYRRTMRKRRPT